MDKNFQTFNLNLWSFPNPFEFPSLSSFSPNFVTTKTTSDFDFLQIFRQNPETPNQNLVPIQPKADNDLINLMAHLNVNQNVPQINLEKEIVNMLRFFIGDYQNKLSLFAEESLKYTNHPKLISLFKILWIRYSQTKYEDSQMRFAVLRTAIRHVIKQIKAKQIIKQESSEKFEENGDEEQLLKLCLSLQISRSRSIKAETVNRLFASQDFRRYYDDFVEKFSEMMFEENLKRFKNCKKYFVDCVEENTVEKVVGYKKLPLQVWEIRNFNRRYE